MSDVRGAPERMVSALSYDALARRLAALERAQEWRLITDNPPRDGETVLLAIDDDGKRFLVTTGEWDQTVGAWNCGLGVLGERDASWIDGEHEWPVTHWKPLGDGPKQPVADGDTDV